MKKNLREMVNAAQQEYNNRIILVKIDGRLKEITDEEVEFEKIEYITTDSSIGNDVYKRSVLLLAIKAIKDVDAKKDIEHVIVEYSISKGFYCSIKGNIDITQEFLDKVKARMKECVEMDMPIIKRIVSTKEAISIFDKNGMEDKKKLFRYRKSSFVNIYNLDGYEDYFYGYMACSTGILKYFDIYKYDEGFVIQMPDKNSPELVPEFRPQPKIFNVLKESTKWADMLDMHTVGALNEHITKGDMGTLMLAHEALQEQSIFEIVKMIQERPETKFIMIAGPSSSGKTTFSHRLSVQLMAKGYKPHAIGVDDYFVEREETPKDENGNYNFEDLHAIDIDLFNQHMNALLAGEKVDMPKFNFRLGKKEYNGKTMQLGKDDILVIEGIHCLNDELSYSLPIESKFKIYISALTQLNIDEHNRVSTTDGRLIRRLVRDYRTRGASAQRTLSMWNSVKRGEEKNIFPYQEQADVMFNSSLAYEISVLKPYVEPLLYSIGEDEPEYDEAKRLLKFLDYFLACQTDYIPINSILREFVGGGCFKVD